MKDTLKSPPAENKTMKKASVVSVAATTLFYLACGCSGYAAFGDKTPGNILTGFGFYEPFWLVDFANACIILHLVGAYQFSGVIQQGMMMGRRHMPDFPPKVYCQPIFAFVEQGVSKSFPSSNFVNKFYKVGFLSSKPCRLNFFRLCFRTLYVASTTGLGILFPYFNQVLGLLGGLNFWPLTLYFPVQMYLVQKKISLWSRKWVALQFLSVVCLMISLFASVGSVVGIIREKLH